MRIITLTTDIGWEYAAEMKGVIYSINPDAIVVDVTHNISPQNVMEGAFILYSIAPYFKKAIHIGVVDPGVGTERKAIIVECENAFFVGPDNGLLIPSAKRLGIKKIYEIKFERENVSPVFHGRDVFSPTAAKLSMGIEPSQMGEETNEYVELDFGKVIHKENRIEGKVLFIDRFGNIITNIKKKLPEFVIKIGNVEEKVRMYPSYGYAREGEILAVTSSSGFLEIAIRNGNAGEYFGAKAGDKIIVKRES